MSLLIIFGLRPSHLFSVNRFVIRYVAIKIHIPTLTCHVGVFNSKVLACFINNNLNARSIAIPGRFAEYVLHARLLPQW